MASNGVEFTEKEQRVRKVWRIYYLLQAVITLLWLAYGGETPLPRVDVAVAFIAITAAIQGFVYYRVYVKKGTILLTTGLVLFGIRLPKEIGSIIPWFTQQDPYLICTGLVLVAYLVFAFIINFELLKVNKSFRRREAFEALIQESAEFKNAIERVKIATTHEDLGEAFRNAVAGQSGKIQSMINEEYKKRKKELSYPVLYSFKKSG